MLNKLRNMERLVRRVRNIIAPSRKYRQRSLSNEALQANSIVLKFGAKTIRWVFQYPHIRDFNEKHILPWAFPSLRTEPRDIPADFNIGVHLHNETLQGGFSELPGKKFALAGEVETRHPRLANCLSFVQGPQPGDDPAYIRYAPIMCFWTPPYDPVKTRKCSVVDSGRYEWRAQLIGKLAEKIGEVDIFGGLSGRKLGGYHEAYDGPIGNDKYLGILDFCFYLALERKVADDYLTEKFADAVLCNAVPIYHGAPNLCLYAYPEASIAVEDVETIDWHNWRSEYDRRLPALRAQKEFFRTHLNVFSYFHTVTDDLSLLDRRRPITL